VDWLGLLGFLRDKLTLTKAVIKLNKLRHKDHPNLQAIMNKHDLSNDQIFVDVGPHVLSEVTELE